MAEFTTGTSPHYGTRSRIKASPQVVETGWYKPVPSHGGYSISTPAPVPANSGGNIPIQSAPFQKEGIPQEILPSVSDLIPQNYQAAVQTFERPTDVRLLEPVEAGAVSETKPIQENAENKTEVPAEEPINISQSSVPPFFPSHTPTTAAQPEDSLSRFLSAQVCAAVILFAAACLFKLASEPLFLQMQQGLQEQLSDMQAVFTAAEYIQQAEEKGISETLQEILSKGLEEDGARLGQGQTEIILSPSTSAAVQNSENHFNGTEPAGGEENPSGNTENIVSSAAAAGGTYPVSMEQMPYALSVIQDGRRSAAAAVLPTEGYLTCKYGPSEHPITGKPDFHTGIDIGAPLGSPIYAAAAGVVEKTGTSSSLGKYLMLRHGSSTITTYSHCSKLLVKEGEAVSCGQEIALVGSSGVSTGPHLHFECIIDGTLTDPAWILELPLPSSRYSGG